MDHLGTFPIKTADLGLHGNLFGGTILFWTDACAVSYVMKMTRQPRLVTKTMNSIFVSPVKAGELLSLYGWPIQIGRTSIQVVVEAKTLNMESTEERMVFTASIVFVCICRDIWRSGIRFQQENYSTSKCSERIKND